ncbi:MAG: hypothetical protein ACK5PQ_01880 [Alphaproteobacteria bacterium]
MIYILKVSAVLIAFVLWVDSGLSGVGFPANIKVSPQNMRSRKNQKLTPASVEFDLSTSVLPKDSYPTIERLAQESAILINNLHKRRELDEVNLNSLMRLRAYLTAVYRKNNNSKLKKTLSSAVAQITQELKSRLDFQERYNRGLVQGPGTSLMTNETNQMSGAMSLAPTMTSQNFVPAGSGAGLTVQRNNALASQAQYAAPSSVPTRNENMMGERSETLARRINEGRLDSSQLTTQDINLMNQAAQPGLSSGVIKSSFARSTTVRPTQMRQASGSDAVNLASMVQARRGRMLDTYLKNKYIVWDQLGEEDRRLVKEFRAQANAKATTPANSSSAPNFDALPPPPEDWLNSSSPTARPESISPESGRIIPAAPPLPSLGSRSASVRANPAPNPRPVARGGNANSLRTDNILNAVGKQIDDRKAQWQNIQNQPDPRDAMQGASDAEWENS